MVFDNIKLEDDPNIDPHGPGGKYGYRLGHSDGSYTVLDRVLNSVDDRKVKVITIGAGVSGILMAHLIQRDCENVEHVIYEKNGDVGGTWLENVYPACCCDVPSHSYTFSFALNADWPQYMATSDDIFRYLTRVCDCFDLRKFMRFNSVVQACEWIENEGQWHITVADALTGETWEDTCHILIGANGLLNSWKYPEEVEGLQSFKGKLIHTARWPDNYGPDQWAKERIAVLGSGASAIQVVPALQKHAKHMDVFIRTAIWFAVLAGHSGVNYDYKDEERQNFKKDTDSLLATAKKIEGGLNGLMGTKAMMAASAEQKMIRKTFEERMKEHITDEEIREMLTPDFAVGCRRLTPGDPFMKAIQQPNVKLHKAAVTKVTSSSVIGSNGDEVEVDTIVCATGFNVSYIPKYPVKGRNGITLKEKWSSIPQGYMGLAVPDMPNYYVFQGPTFPVSNGSVMGPLQTVGAYIIQMIQKMQKERIHSFAPKPDVTAAFNHHAQTWLKGTCWSEQSCRSWYKDNETGRVNAVWPGSSLHYCEMIETPRFEDYDIRYQDGNMFSFMGLGFTMNQVKEGGDLSPYISKAGLEEKFYSFEPSADEEERVLKRKHRVNEGPKPNGATHMNGHSHVNGAR